MDNLFSNLPPLHQGQLLFRKPITALFGKPATLWLEFWPPSQSISHIVVLYHNSALYISFHKGRVQENPSPWNRPLKVGVWGAALTWMHSAFFNLHYFFGRCKKKLDSDEILKKISPLTCLRAHARKIRILRIADFGQFWTISAQTCFSSCDGAFFKHSGINQQCQGNIWAKTPPRAHL